MHGSWKTSRRKGRRVRPTVSGSAAMPRGKGWHSTPSVRDFALPSAQPRSTTSGIARYETTEGKFQVRFVGFGSGGYTIRSHSVALLLFENCALRCPSRPPILPRGRRRRHWRRGHRLRASSCAPPPHRALSRYSDDFALRSDTALMQNRRPLGGGPSGNTWPKCASQTLHVVSICCMP